MLKRMRKQLKNEKGLTLVELLAVIVILAIIAAIAIPAIGNIIENSRYNAVKADAINVLNAANMYFTENPDEESVTVEGAEGDSGLVDEGFLESAGKIETGTVTKGSPSRLSASGIAYSGTKTVDFEDASVDDINNDDQKGSESGNKKISGTTDPDE